MAGEETLFESAGHYLGVQVGTGVRVTEAARQAYRGLKKISLPGSPFYRNDIGLRCRRELDKLQAHGFAAGMEY
jgi:phosphoribosylamine-glycine ligase